jgi:hypothetical protein
MNRSTEISDPFSRHRKAETQPVQVQPAVEAVEIDPKSSTEAPTVEPRPATKSVERKPVVRAANPFAQHTNKTERRPRPARAQVPPAERLMAWLPRWPKATISVRDVRLQRPRPEAASDRPPQRLCTPHRAARRNTPMTVLLFAIGFAAGMLTSYLIARWELAR